MTNKVIPPHVEDEATSVTEESTKNEAETHAEDTFEPAKSGEAFFLKQLATLQQEAEEYKNQALRAIAEMENIRRRAQEDIQKASKFAIESFAEQLLSVKDSLEMALASPTQEVSSLQQGVELTLKQLNHAFERARILEVPSEGQPFDPHIHQAVSTIQNDAPDNTVVQVYQKGYRLNDRVLRPAMVVVAKN